MHTETAARATGSDDYARPGYGDDRAVRAVPELPGVTQAERALDEALDGLLLDLRSLAERLADRVLRPTPAIEDADQASGDIYDGSRLAASMRNFESRIGMADSIVQDLLHRLDV